VNKKVSYGLNKEFMGLLENEFQIGPLIESYQKALEGASETGRDTVAEEIFGTFGRNLGERILQMEGEYRDQTARVAYRIADQTGHPFPAYQQTPLEIGLLAVMNANKWAYEEISYKRLAYEVSICVLNQALIRALPRSMADAVPCRYLCLGFYEAICKNTGIWDRVTINMTSKISDEKSRCAFEALYSHE